MTTKEMTEQMAMEMTNVTIQEQAAMEMIGKKRTKHAKPVLCITEGKMFASTYDAAEYYGASQTAISAACRGVYPTCKGMKFCYVDKVKENLPVIAEEIQVKAKHNGGSKPRMVKCVETGIEYPSINDWAREIGVSKTTLYYHLRRKTKGINGNHYVFVEDECAECVKEMAEIIEKANPHAELMSKIELLEDYRRDCQACRDQYSVLESKLQSLKTEMDEILKTQRSMDDELITKSKLVQDLEAEIRNMLNL